jgi:glutathione S-transferase
MSTKSAELLPVLYSFRRCPYAMRARMALYLGGLKVEIREINLRDKPDLFLSTSPKGTVPVLVWPDGSLLEESLDIVNMVAERVPDFKAKDAALFSAWLQRLDDELRPACHRIKYTDRFVDVDLKLEHQRCQRYCKRLEELLCQQDYLHGHQPGQADCVIFPFVRQLSRVDETILHDYNVPAVMGWLARVSDSEMFAKVMEKNAVWVPDSLSE